MLTIGLLHGMSSVATADYYRRINERVNEILGDHERAQLLLWSVNFADIERFVRDDRWDDAANYLVRRALALQQAGADFVMCWSNTMHRVASAIETALDVPFVHIVDPVADEAHARGLKTLGLLGTLPTMEADFYRERYAQYALAVLTPDDEDRHLVDSIIFDELTRNVFTDASKQHYLRIIRRLKAAGAEAVVLGCTEIGLLVQQADLPHLPFLDTTVLHVERAVQLALGHAPLTGTSIALAAAESHSPIDPRMRSQGTKAVV